MEWDGMGWMGWMGYMTVFNVASDDGGRWGTVSGCVSGWVDGGSDVFKETHGG